MRTSFFALMAICLLAVAPAAQAVITGWNCDDDGDGVLDMVGVSATDPPLISDPTNGDHYRMDIVGSHNDTPEDGIVGHLSGDIAATPEDPTLWLVQTLDNDTNFDWTDYHVTIGMSQDFTISANSMIVPAGWTWSISQPVAGMQPNGNAGYVGTIDYYYNGAGTEILMGDPATIGLIVNFVGPVAFCTEQYPTPEPAALAMMAMGLPLILRRRRA